VVLPELAEAEVREDVDAGAAGDSPAQHIVMVPGVLDPRESHGGRASRRSTASRIPKGSGAVAAWPAPPQTVARLRAVGATVIDAPPGAPGAPIWKTAYLRVKATAA